MLLLKSISGLFYPGKSSKSLTLTSKKQTLKGVIKKRTRTLKSSSLQFQRKDLRICHVMLGKFLSCSEPPSRQIGLLFITNLPDTFLPSIQRPLDPLPPRFPFLSPSLSVKCFSDHYLSSWFFIPTHHLTKFLRFFTFFSFSTRLENKVLFSASCTVSQQSVQYL